MRRDVYIENDSGGFSVLAVDAVDDIIEDQRGNDFGFVEKHKVLLLELYGDDSMPVRIVVDEPLTAEEEAQWLARASWQIDTSDGRMLVMGGFDPDVLSWWREQGDPDADGRGVGAFMAAPGKWRVDLYAHAGSMNGRAILDEAGTPVGAAFRKSHPGRAFPLWLAERLDHSGEDDPGFEDLWKDARASMEAGKLAIDGESGEAIGFVVHVTRATTPAGDPPESGWFDREAGQRIPATFPLGLSSHVLAAHLQHFRNNLFRIKIPEAPRPVADQVVEVIEVWSGDPLKPIEGGPVSLPLADLYLLHWAAGMTADRTPRFELWVEPKGAWTPPASTPDYAVVQKAGSITAIGAVANTGGWHTWWTSRDVAKAIGDIPDGSELTLGTVQIFDDPAGPQSSEVGQALYSGKVQGGVWQIDSASPRVSRDVLEQAIDFMRDVAQRDQLRVASAAERKVVEREARRYALLRISFVWDGDVVRLGEPDDRTLLLVGPKAFRIRFANTWPMDVEEDDEDDDE